MLRQGPLGGHGTPTLLVSVGVAVLVSAILLGGAAAASSAPPQTSPPSPVPLPHGDPSVGETRSFAGPTALPQLTATEVEVAPPAPDVPNEPAGTDLQTTGVPSESAPPPGPNPAVPSPGTSASFSGLVRGRYATYNDSAPPDTIGAVGPNHVVTASNFTVRIQNRSGTELSTFGLLSFFQGAFPTLTFTFDPKVMYDEMSDRWILVAIAEARSAASSVLIAVSNTGDPTGAWFVRRDDADSTDTVWADYPSIAFNSKWIVVTTNDFLIMHRAASTAAGCTSTTRPPFIARRSMHRRFSTCHSPPSRIRHSRSPLR